MCVNSSTLYGAFGCISSRSQFISPLGALKPRGISNIVWAYATAQVSHPHPFHKVADEVVSRRLETFNPQHFANVVWAYATSHVSRPILFDGMADAVIERRHALNSQDIANIVWAYASSGIVESSFLAGMVLRVVILLDQCGDT